eukprot:11216560-Heterocapsa_arctica.AAC.1
MQLNPPESGLAIERIGNEIRDDHVDQSIPVPRESQVRARAREIRAGTLAVMLAVIGGRELRKTIPEPLASPAGDVHLLGKSTATITGHVTAGAEAPTRRGSSTRIEARAESSHKDEHLSHFVPPNIRHAYKGAGVGIVNVVQIINNNTGDGDRKPKHTVGIQAHKSLVVPDKVVEAIDPEVIRPPRLAVDRH